MVVYFLVALSCWGYLPVLTSINSKSSISEKFKKIIGKIKFFISKVYSKYIGSTHTSYYHAL